MHYFIYIVKFPYFLFPGVNISNEIQMHFPSVTHSQHFSLIPTFWKIPKTENYAETRFESQI